MTTVDPFHLRLATDADVPVLERLIDLSARVLQKDHYSREQLDVAIGPVFGVDRRLIEDGTFFVVEHDGEIVGCGGWSRRKAMYGGDRDRVGEDGVLDWRIDPARIRAFFIHPEWTRRGIGRRILAECEAAIRAAGFARAELVATLTGEPLYASAGYEVLERVDAPLPNGLKLPVVRMGKALR